MEQVKAKPSGKNLGSNFTSSGPIGQENQTNYALKAQSKESL